MAELNVAAQYGSGMSAVRMILSTSHTRLSAAAVSPLSESSKTT